MPEYGSDEYYEKLHELEDRGFFEMYNPNFWEQNCNEDRVEDDGWEEEEYERT